MIAPLIRTNEVLRNMLIEKSSTRRRNTIVTKLNLMLINRWNGQKTKAVTEVYKLLMSLPQNATITKSQMQKIDQIFTRHMSKSFADAVEDSVFTATEDTYKIGIKDALKPLKLRMSFSVMDRNATEILGKHNLFWCRNYYSDNLQAVIDNQLNEYFTSKRTIHDIAGDLSAQLSKIDRRNTPRYFQGLAEHVTNRVRELGKVSGFEKGKITHYRIVAKIDERTSKICRKLNGTKIPVKNSIEFRDKILSLKSPAEIKEFAPWVRETSVDRIDTSKLPLGLALPPYHYFCRTQVIADL